jgi:peptidoglycan lytic transglycosylase
MPRTATLLAAALALGVSLALPAGALADGSAGGTSAPDTSVSTGASTPGAANSAGSLKAGRAALLGRWQRVAGTLDSAGAGQALLLQRTDGRSGWVTVARATTGKAGGFSARWRPTQIGRFTLRAVPATASATASAADALPTTPTTVYRAAIATQYGEGSYGSRTACGVILRPTTIGVAHRTLPCGTMVEFYFRGATVRAPVIDRGPYANNADWDLTNAAASRLKFNGLDYVGAMRVGRVKLARS